MSIKQNLMTFEEIKKDIIDKLPKEYRKGSNVNILVDAFAKAMLEQQETLRKYFEELNNEN